MPGRDSGITIFHRFRISEEPSMAAASSNSLGTWSMKFLSNQMANGMDVADSTREV